MTKAADPALRLSDRIDRAAVAEALRTRGRAQIRDLLPEAAARRLLECLRREVAWNITFNDDKGKVHTIFPNQIEAMTDGHRAWLKSFTEEHGRYGFQFLFRSYPLWDIWAKGGAPDLYAFRFMEFVNGPEFLGLIREVTGQGDITMADAQATLFGPGDFLTRHTDENPGKGRRLAYVLNLSPAWQAEWGGVLEFLDADGNVAEGFVPRFNTLNLFTVPANHHVSYVSPLAAAGRYSITGWLRADPTMGKG
ncbi:MAG TPA: 2OG-Fe(II) oxygenase family protein [Azospirillaceae bacterium]|nr:2OG-Fe(II) oxygenase family protein [Azospirillaceae bacterium]